VKVESLESEEIHACVTEIWYGGGADAASAVTSITITPHGVSVDVNGEHLKQVPVTEESHLCRLIVCNYPPALPRIRLAVETRRKHGRAVFTSSLNAI